MGTGTRGRPLLADKIGEEDVTEVVARLLNRRLKISERDVDVGVGNAVGVVVDDPNGEVPRHVDDRSAGQDRRGHGDINRLVEVK